MKMLEVFDRHTLLTRFIHLQ